VQTGRPPQGGLSFILGMTFALWSDAWRSFLAWEGENCGDYGAMTGIAATQDARWLNQG
jgi:hypothetical protein